MLYIDNTKLLSLQALLNQILTNIQMLVQNAATLGASAAEMLAKDAEGSGSYVYRSYYRIAYRLRISVLPAVLHFRSDGWCG